MKIGAITPDRGDRPRFLERCKEYVARQTLKVDYHEIINYPQKTHPVDITERYMVGLHKLKDKCDVILLIENDDWYPATYVEYMVYDWIVYHKPKVFGIGETYFYHIPSQSWVYREHPERACAYQTMISTKAVDEIDAKTYNPLLFDFSLWRQFKEESKATTFGCPLAVGIKHGFGICGAAGHNKWFYDHEPTAQKDKNYEWLKSQMGEADAEWYIKMAKEKQP